MIKYQQSLVLDEKWHEMLFFREESANIFGLDRNGKIVYEGNLRNMDAKSYANYVLTNTPKAQPGAVEIMGFDSGRLKHSVAD